MKLAAVIFGLIGLHRQGDSWILVFPNAGHLSQEPVAAHEPRILVPMALVRQIEARDLSGNPQSLPGFIAVRQDLGVYKIDLTRVRFTLTSAEDVGQHQPNELNPGDDPQVVPGSGAYPVEYIPRLSRMTDLSGYTMVDEIWNSSGPMNLLSSRGRLSRGNLVAGSFTADCRAYLKNDCTAPDAGQTRWFLADSVRYDMSPTATLILTHAAGTVTVAIDGTGGGTLCIAHPPEPNASRTPNHLHAFYELMRDARGQSPPVADRFVPCDFDLYHCPSLPNLKDVLPFYAREYFYPDGIGIVTPLNRLSCPLVNLP